MVTSRRVLLALTVVFAPALASAATFGWTAGIPLQGGGSLYGSGQLVTQDALSNSFDFNQTGFTGFLLTSITGTFDGVAISGLLPVDTGQYGNDNLVNVTPTYIDNNGIAFSLASTPPGLGDTVNLYFDAAFSQSYRAGSASIPAVELTGGTFTLTPVPLPASLWLLVTALGGLAAIARVSG